MGEAVLTSWRFDPGFIALLALAAWLYARGWRRAHYQPEQLVAWLCGLAALFIALASPLDAFGNLLLEAHMVQHLLLIVVAPPLLLLGKPVVPLMLGLPAEVLKNGLGPFLRFRPLQRAGKLITHPVFCWMAMTATIVFWHLPRFYELALNFPAWHGVEHACFFYASVLFWWPIILGPRHWALIPYLILADMVNTGLSAWLVFSTHVVYRTYELAPRLGGLTALDDQTTAGAIMWVPGSVAYLIPAFLITMQLLNGRSPAPLNARPRPHPAREPFDLLRVPFIGRIMRYKHFRRILQAAMFALAVCVMIDGFTGAQIAPLNLAGILPWTYWRGLTVIALLAAGNFFCMACPFTLARNLGLRALPQSRKWPLALRSKWLAVALLVVYFWAYENFSLWNSPWWTAWVITGYFVTAFAVDGFFGDASFCKYVCPIGQFHFINSQVSPLEITLRSPAVCADCRTRDCIRGNDTQPGCEMNLFQPRKAGNFNCTFCLDCVQACPHDNIGIRATVPGKSLLHDRAQRPDLAMLAWVLTFAALANAASMVNPVMAWAHRLQGLWLIAALAIPAAVLTSATPTRRYGFAFVPLGFSIWAAHFVFHLLQMKDWLLPAQILVLDAGLVLSFYYSWRLANKKPVSVIPWALLAAGVWAAAVWVLFQPMQMRGMVMQ